MFVQITVYLSNQSGSSTGFVSPVGGNLWFAFVVPCQTMNTWFNQNQTEFGISVFPKQNNKKNDVIVYTGDKLIILKLLPVPFQMFSDCYGFLD